MTDDKDALPSDAEKSALKPRKPEDAPPSQSPEDKQAEDKKAEDKKDAEGPSEQPS